jgi:hypothetical protein
VEKWCSMDGKFSVGNVERALSLDLKIMAQA